MNITFGGRAFLRGLFLSPYVAPVIAVALAWVLLLDPGPGGTLNALLIQLGVIETPISFLGQRAVEINILGLRRSCSCCALSGPSTNSTTSSC